MAISIEAGQQLPQEYRRQMKPLRFAEFSAGPSVRTESRITRKPVRFEMPEMRGPSEPSRTFVGPDNPWDQGI